MGTYPDLIDCIVEYARGQGGGEVNARPLRTKTSKIPCNGNGTGQNWVARIHGGHGVGRTNQTAIRVCNDTGHETYSVALVEGVDKKLPKVAHGQ